MNATSPSPFKPHLITAIALSLLFIFAAYSGLSRTEHAYQIGRV